MRPVSGQDQTGELSWPLVDRRHVSSDVAVEIDRRQNLEQQQVDQLSRANQLLLSLQKIAITLPSSLDLEKVLDQGVEQVRELIGSDAFTVLVTSPGDPPRMKVVRGKGSADKLEINLSDFPPHIASSFGYNHSVAFPLSLQHKGFANDAVLGIYCALRSRGLVVGLIAAEWLADRDIHQAKQVLTGLADALGIAIDNANLFKEIRRHSAEEERQRIARELHDRTGSTLAYVGLELDRLIRLEQNSAITADLTTVRQQISLIVSEVREMLYDLRAGSDGNTPLDDAVRHFATRVSGRSGIQVRCDISTTPSFDIRMTNEIWEIIKESILNAERHSGGSKILIRTFDSVDYWHVEISDNGIGIDDATARDDSYGLTGLFERAEGIGAVIDIESPVRGTQSGTKISLTIPHIHLSGTPKADGI